MNPAPLRTTAPVATGWALGLFATFCFSVAPPIARAVIAAGLDPTAILAVRMVITTLLLVATIAVTNPARLRSDRRGVGVALGAGVINGFGMMGYFWSLTRLHVSVAAMLFSLSPLVVLSVLALRGERVTRRHLLRLALALGGIYFLVGPSGDVDPVGVLLLSISIVAFAFQVIFIQWYLRDYDARTVTLYMIAGMAVVPLAVWLAQGAPWVDPGRGGWTAILVLAMVSTYLARLAFFGAIGRIGGAQMALLTPLETLLTVVWSVLFLGERLTAVQWLGGLLILGSALLAVQRLGRVRVPVRWRLWAKA